MVKASLVDEEQIFDVILNWVSLHKIERASSGRELLKLHDIAGQCTSFVAEDIFNLA